MKFINPISASELAQWLDAELEGNPHLMVHGINEIHQVEPGDLSFVDHPKYYDKCLQSAATAILINKKVPFPDGKTLLISHDPFRDYNRIVKHYKPFIPLQANRGNDCEIGKGTCIQPGAVVGHRVKIGKDCLIHPNVVIYDDTIIGDRVIIHANTVIGADAFYFKRRPEGYDKMRSCGRVVIGDDVEIGASCTIDKGVSGDTVIGKGSKLDNQIHIGHDTHIGEHCLFAAQVGIAGVTTIESNVILWGQVGVSKDLVIGEGAIVLAQSGVSKSLKAGQTYFGSPADEARKRMREMAALRSIANKE